MICLRSQLHLNKNASASEIWNAIAQWRINSRNTPKDIKEWFLKNPFEKLQDKPVDIKFN